KVPCFRDLIDWGRLSSLGPPSFLVERAISARLLRASQSGLRVIGSLLIDILYALRQRQSGPCCCSACSCCPGVAVIVIGGLCVCDSAFGRKVSREREKRENEMGFLGPEGSTPPTSLHTLLTFLPRPSGALPT